MPRARCGPECGSRSPILPINLTRRSPSSPDRIAKRPSSARSYFEGNPPTSPAIAILRDGKLVYLMQRFVIEQATAQQIAGELIRAFDEFCAKTPA